jgi:menaquinol-cytochrome c reductase iron-sulfur subunit
MGHAEAYKDDGTPQEQSRRTFMVNAVVAMGGVIGLSLAIPLVTSMIPAADALTQNWSPLTPDEFKKLQAATEKPIKVAFAVKSKDGYLPEASEDEFVWAVKTDQAAMEKSRPDLFKDGKDLLPYPVVNMGFALFSPICPHLGCRFDWNDGQSKFVCPCHGSVYSNLGEHLAGPAQRGLDPLPMRDQNGTAEVTWIVYEGNVSDRVIVSYS